MLGSVIVDILLFFGKGWGSIEFAPMAMTVFTKPDDTPLNVKGALGPMRMPESAFQ